MKKQPKKVMQVTHLYLPHLGGIELYVYRLSRDMMLKKLECYVVTSSQGQGRVGRYADLGIQVIALPSKQLLPRNPFLFGFRKTVQEVNPHVVHIHSIWFLSSLQAAVLKRRYKYKLINTVHGVLPDQASFPVKVFIFLFKGVANYILRQSDVIIVLGESEKDKLIRNFSVSKEKIKVIGNGIDTTVPDPRAVTALNQKYGDYILFTGRIIADKNPDLLIRAFVRIASEYPSLRLLFLGPINEKYKQELLILAKPITDRVVFLGSLHPIREQLAIANLYAAASLSVSIGSWEGLPTRVLESLAQGTPVVAYDSGACSSLIKDGYNSYIISDLNEMRLAEKITAYMSLSATDRSMLCRRALDSVKNYAWKEKFEAINDIYS